MEDDQGILHDYSDKRNLITTGFACEMTNRYSCYQCEFAGVNRMSDFTIGDYWGVKDYQERHHKGVSAIIAHSERAVEFLKNCTPFMEIREADIWDIVSHNKPILK